MKRAELIPVFIMTALVAAFVGHGFLGRADYGVAAGSGRDEAAAYTEGRPNLVAATFYSAWCSACAVLDPKLRRVAPEFDGRAVEFAKFDFTMGQTDDLAAKAAALGVEDVYLEQKGGTGFMALIDRRSQSVLGVVTMGQSEREIRTAIDAAITAASVS